MEVCPYSEFIDLLQRKYEKLQTEVRAEHDALKTEYPHLSRLIYLPIPPTFSLRVCIGLALLLPTLGAYFLDMSWVGVALWLIIGVFSAPWSALQRIDAMWSQCQAAEKVYYALNFSSVLYTALVSAKTVQREWIEEQLDTLRQDFAVRTSTPSTSSGIMNQSLFC